MVNDKEFAKFQDGMFKTHFEKFIEFKRGKGEKVARSSLIRLRSLNGDLNRYCSSLEISRDVAEAILRERDSEHPATRALRISDLRQFSAFLNGHGIRTYQIPLKYAKQARTSFRPYIFSDLELSAITQAVDNYENNSRRKNPVDIYPVIVRILMGTGMRIGEALSLRVKDIEINPRVRQ